MDKQQVLESIKDLSSTGNLSQQELLAAFNAGKGTTETQAISSGHASLADVMYYIGGAIVFLGIIILCTQNWESFNTPVKILLTLGTCVAFYIVAALLHKYQNLKNVSQAFFLLSGLLAPIGVYVTLDKMSVDLNSNTVQVLVYFGLLAVFLCSFLYFKRTVLVLFSIIFATTLFHFIIFLLMGGAYPTGSKVVEYEFLVIGLAYIFLGYYLNTTSQKALTGVLYGFGSLIFLGTAMYLGGWQPNQNTFWELIYPLLVFGIIFISVYVRSRSFLVFGSLFLIGYIGKLTSEYFSTGLGWPFALVLAGLLIMAVGYYAVRINKKYLTSVSLK